MFGAYDMRILWAEAFGPDDARTAIVIQCHDKLLGGVAYLTELDVDFGFARHVDMMRYEHIQLDGSVKAKLKMHFEWYEIVDSAEAFRNSRRWQEERQRKLQAPQQLLEAPK